jgi:hypothetical protein
VPDESAGRGAARQGLAEHVKVQPGATSHQQSLGRSDGLAKPQKVDQQLGQVPAAMPANVNDPVRDSQHLKQRPVTLQQIDITPDEQLQRPVPAAAGPPPTGASSTPTPRASAAAASTCPTAGELLVMSIHVAVAGNTVSAPPRPAITSCTSRGPGSIVTRTSTIAAAPAAVAAHRAPQPVTASSSSACASPTAT